MRVGSKLLMTLNDLLLVVIDELCGPNYKQDVESTRTSTGRTEKIVFFFKKFQYSAFPHSLAI